MPLEPSESPSKKPLPDHCEEAPHITLFNHGPISVLYYASPSPSTSSSKGRSHSRSTLSGRSETTFRTTLDLNGIPMQAAPNSPQGGRPRHDSSSPTSRRGADTTYSLETQVPASPVTLRSRKATHRSSFYQSPLNLSSPEVHESSGEQSADADESTNSSLGREEYSEVEGPIAANTCFTSNDECPSQSNVRQPESLLDMPLIEVHDSLPTESDAWKITPLYQPNSLRSSSSTVSTSYLRTDAFAGHRDTLARIRFSRRPAPYIPVVILSRICRYLSFQDYKSLRLTNKIWLGGLPLPQLPSVYFLPGEVIQEIYRYLRPQDFDAARHACRAWLLASLDRTILTKMLKQSGYWHAAEVDLQQRIRKASISPSANRVPRISGLDGPTDFSPSPLPVELETEEWILSKRLATECMLSHEWRGNCSPAAIRFERFSIVATVDFKDYIADSGESPSHSTNAYGLSKPLFTVSGCGRYVLLSEDCVISVYEILKYPPEALKAITSIHCPCDVQAVSMNTSCGRYAVAALLDCRMGIVCDIQDAVFNTRDAKPSYQSHDFNAIAFTSLDASAQNGRHTSQSVPQKPQQIMTTRAYPDKKSAKGKTVVPLGSKNYSRISSNNGSRRSSKQGIPIETGPRSIYRNLGSVEDPPRSVAICPQRRCVAFGCGLGVELHWIDAMSEADLNRWFPLSAPADFLFFLPPRAQADNPSKLRLISSAAGRAQPEINPHHPLARHSVSTLLPSIEPKMAHSRFMTRLFFGNLPTRTIASSVQHAPGHLPALPTHDAGLLRAVECDHYHAVPLADGVHTLFTDPQSNHLCLGSDAPLGNPTKLLRKVVFEPPKDISTPQLLSQARPSHYTAGPDMSRGVRVVASYNSHVILYSLPSDIFEELRRVVLPFAGADNLISTTHQLGNSDLLMDTYINGQDNESESVTGSEDLLSSVAWGSRSIRIQGVYVGYLAGVEAFSLQCSHGGVRIWAFSSGGKGCVWDIERRVGAEKKILVHANGRAETLRDAAQRNDVLMEDDLTPDWDDPSSCVSSPNTSTPSPTSTRPESSRQVTFSDGACEIAQNYIADVGGSIEALFDEIELYDCGP